jgi:hypothetical protein
MKRLLEQVEKLTAAELARSYEKFPAFNGPHEGYAVILEEVDELKDEVNVLECDMGGLWQAVKHNEKPNDRLKIIKNLALNTSAEAIQVAAMAQKFIDSMELKGIKA